MRRKLWAAVGKDMEGSIAAVTQASALLDNADKYGRDQWSGWLPMVVDDDAPTLIEQAVVVLLLTRLAGLVCIYYGPKCKLAVFRRWGRRVPGHGTRLQ
jgi:hypothetical protein